MRTYGRVKRPDGTYGPWQVVTTDANGFDDAVWLTTLLQTLKLFLNESPFYANYGVPAKTAIVQQVAPDYYVARTQQQFSQYFASLIVARVPTEPTPTYTVNVTSRQGFRWAVNVAPPQ